jgi:hypothetical protein
MITAGGKIRQVNIKTIGTKIALYIPNALTGIIGLKKVAKNATDVVTDVINIVLEALRIVNARRF